jgi:hypothetical protein
MKSNQLPIKMTLQKKTIFEMHKASILLIVIAVIVAASIFLAPAFSQSTSPCSSCHGGYYQYLDILEGNAANQLPVAINVGQTATITVVVENKVNTALYTTLSSVSLSLASQSGHFTVNVPAFNVGTLQKGTTTATWQITGVSAGADAFVISASARNSHKNLQFQDIYSPSLALTVSDPAPTPTPTTSPTSTPTLSPTASPTPTPSPTTVLTPTPTPAPSPSPTLIPTPVPTVSPTPAPIPSPTSTPTPTTSPTPTPAPTPTPTPTPTQIPTISPTPIPSPAPSLSPTPIPIVTPTPSPTPNATTTPNPTPSSTPTPNPLPSPTPSATTVPTPTPTLSLTTIPSLTSSPTLELATNQTIQLSQTPALRVWFRHPSEDETWISGSTKIVEWGTTYGSGDLVAKLELSKSGISGPWITLAENLTNVNYYILRVPNLEQNDRCIISVTVSDVSESGKISSDIAPIRITQITDGQIMLSFLFIPGILFLVLALARKQVLLILKNRTVKVIQIKAEKYPTIHFYFEKIERMISTFHFNLKGEKND